MSVFRIFKQLIIVFVIVISGKLAAGCLGGGVVSPPGVPPPDPNPFDRFSLSGYTNYGSCYDIAQTDPAYTAYYQDGIGEIGSAYTVFSDGSFQSYWINGEAMLDDASNIYWPGDYDDLFHDYTTSDFYWPDLVFLYDNQTDVSYYSHGAVYHDPSAGRIYLADGTQPAFSPNESFALNEIGFQYNLGLLTFSVIHELTGAGGFQSEGAYARYFNMSMGTLVDDYFYYYYVNFLDPALYENTSEIYFENNSDNSVIPWREGVFQIIPLDDFNDVVMVRGSNQFMTRCNIYVENSIFSGKSKIQRSSMLQTKGDRTGKETKVSKGTLQRAKRAERTAAAKSRVLTDAQKSAIAARLQARSQKKPVFQSLVRFEKQDNLPQKSDFEAPILDLNTLLP